MACPDQSPNAALPLPLLHSSPGAAAFRSPGWAQLSPGSENPWQSKANLFIWRLIIETWPEFCPPSHSQKTQGANGAVTKEQRGGSPRRGEPQGTCNQKGLSQQPDAGLGCCGKGIWVSLFASVNLERFGLDYLSSLPLRRACHQVWFTQGFLWKLLGTLELANFTRRKVMLRKPSGRESSWTLRGGSET